MSLLAQQLKKIANVQAPIRSKEKASILFDGKQAADMDRESLWTLAQTALGQLKKLHPSFAQCESLFSEGLKDQDRMLLTPEENTKIDALVSLFLRLVSPWLLQSPALHCIEWLIRRFKYFF